MEFLGVGPLELLFIFLIALIVLGPKDIVKAGRTMGRFLRKVINSPTWQAVKQTSREMRTLPSRLMQEAGMQDEIKEFQDMNRDVQELKKISTSFSLKEVENENKGPLPELSNRKKLPVDQSASEPSPAASETSFSPDRKTVNPLPPNDSQESRDASIEPEQS